MTSISGDKELAQFEKLVVTPELANALGSRQFRRFLDRIPLAILITDVRERELIIYGNPKVQQLCGHNPVELQGRPVSEIKGEGDGPDAGVQLRDAITQRNERIGRFRLESARGEAVLVEAYAHLIEDDEGQPAFRLIAMANLSEYADAWREQLERQIRDKDMLLKELQHRVKNNLQIITALIRLEARNLPTSMPSEPFDRLAGRVESLALLYSLLSKSDGGREVDLGIYLGQIASAVMASHAVEGIRLDLKVDTYPVSVNVAMPTGLVVNELLTNALKHGFAGRESGTVTLHSIRDSKGYRVVVADDGVGLPEGAEWPKPGGLGVLILDTLRENAEARIDVHSAPGMGMRVTISFPQPTH